MRKLIVLFLFTLPLSCSEDDFTDTYGTQLLTIDYAEREEAWSENYQYRSDGRVARVEDFRSLGRRYDLEYQDTVLHNVLTYWHPFKKSNPGSSCGC
jgi:hypothetical protein